MGRFQVLRFSVLLTLLPACCGYQHGQCDVHSALAEGSNATRIRESTGRCVLVLVETGIVLRSDSIDPRPPVIQMSDGRFVTATFHPGR
jgi:hypothetical protein